MIEKTARRTGTDTGRRRMPVARALPGFFLLFALVPAYLAPFNAAADWTTITETAADGATQRDSARVTNPEGHFLIVQRDSNGVIRGTFSLNGDGTPLDERSCPSIRIDDQKPRALTELDGPCEIEDRTAQFTLGVISDGVIQSILLTQLINGKRIFVWYHVKNRGYQETEFTLRGSMQALMKAMDEQVKVLPQ